MAVPLVFSTRHRVEFSHLDPYNHLGTGQYATFFTDHRMDGLREHLGWDLPTIESLPFMVWVRRLEIDFLRSVSGDQTVTIESSVREFRGSDAIIDATMTDPDGGTLARCVMTVAYVDKGTRRAVDWPPDAQALFFADG
jgi:acyl-CoA thioester hydrolase